MISDPSRYLEWSVDAMIKAQKLAFVKSMWADFGLNKTNFA